MLELIETEESVTIRLPAPQRVGVILPLTFIAAGAFYGVIWWGYQWLAAIATVRQGIAYVSMYALVLAEAVALRFLLLELATTRLVFERTTIGVMRSVLGIRVARRWYSCYRVAQFLITHDARHPGDVRLDLFLHTGARVLVAQNIPSDSFVHLTHTLRRKGFAYLREEEDD